MSRTMKIGIMGPPTAAVLRRQARRRALNRAGKRATLVTLPELRRPLTPAEKARFERTKRIGESFGRPGIDSVFLVRQLRDGGLFMPDPPAKPRKKTPVPRRIEIPEPTRKPNSAQRALMRRMERIRESFGKPCRPITDLIREIHERDADLRD